jgi:hypothetical protein
MQRCRGNRAGMMEGSMMRVGDGQEENVSCLSARSRSVVLTSNAHQPLHSSRSVS